MIPLILRIKKESHKNIAKAQDIIIETLFQIQREATLHGGTGIWRCYQGNRFSDDVDVYMPKNTEKINEFFSALEKKGFIIEKKKISENSIYSSLKLNQTVVRFEALFKKVKSILKEYETIESNFITVYTLTSEQFLEEKVNTYLTRKKIRDLYDIFFLLRLVDKTEKIKNILKKLIEHFQKPVDEDDLKVIIISGLVPTAEELMTYIKNF